MILSKFWSFIIFFSVFGLFACNEQPDPQQRVVTTATQQVRIGYQKSSTLMTLLKQSGELEQALKAENINVSWHEFASGQPLAEALNAGSIDVTADVADTVPIFAQVAGAKLAYYAKEAASPQAQAILVPFSSQIKSVVDLKGKKVAVTKAAGSHYLLIAALQRAGLNFKDIQPAWLSPADGRAAFENGSVDAWVTWEPYVSSGRVLQHAKTLISGQDLADYQRYYLTSQQFAQQHPEVLALIINQLRQKAAWVKAEPEAAAKILAPLWGNLPLKVVEQANTQRSYQVEAVDHQDLDKQQKIADRFYQENLIPNSIDKDQIVIFSFNGLL